MTRRPYEESEDGQHLLVPPSIVPPGVYRSYWAPLDSRDREDPGYTPGSRAAGGPDTPVQKDVWCWAPLKQVMLLDVADPLPGDILLRYTDGGLTEKIGTSGTSFFLVTSLVGRVMNAKRNGEGDEMMCFSDYPDHRPYGVVRAGAVPSVAPAKAAPSAWNGRCVRCGRGTYTGLFRIEHEGGDCR